MKEDVFMIVTEFFSKVINEVKHDLIDKPMSEVFVINKFKDYYDLLTDMRGLYKVYFVIDDIADIESFSLYKKNIKKFIEVSLLFQEINFVLISNFDLKVSELNFSFVFDSFVSIHMFSHLNTEPSSIALKESDVKSVTSPLNVEYILRVFYSKLKLNNRLEKINNSFYSNWIGQLIFYFINLNEFIYSLGIVKQNYDSHSSTFRQSQSIGFNNIDSKRKTFNMTINNNKLETRINQVIRQSVKAGLIKTKNLISSLSILSLENHKSDDVDHLVNIESKSRFKDIDAKPEKRGQDLLYGKQS